MSDIAYKLAQLARWLQDHDEPRKAELAHEAGEEIERLRHAPSGPATAKMLEWAKREVQRMRPILGSGDLVWMLDRFIAEWEPGQQAAKAE